ncbi:hypothetical protein K435DRAFT_782822 [Dendrothele bispora CBS 962.96]|uniref:TPR-like protein n=1 Tax=Dendrothele bispora (strain CBS 962.96) TaxID=1314807 RepID=A0A4S8LCI7_DENBC|nr:hypothetical protein K435DRAFT_782822 [Dendrothele bispora CBS 962.96]
MLQFLRRTPRTAILVSRRGLLTSPSCTPALSRPVLLFQSRNYSALLDQPKPRKFGTWLKVVLIASTAFLGYGGYVLYETLTMWPPEIRGDLRDAIGAKLKGELELSERHFHRAWNVIQTLPVSSLGDQPYLKLTGIAVAFADVLELSGKPARAYEVCVDALLAMQKEDAKDRLTGPEKLRAVSIGSKLGQLAEELDRPLDEQEKWLVWTVEEMLKLVKAEGKGSSKAALADEQVNLPLLVVPSWISKADMGSPLEALGAFYARTGRTDYAMPLYLQAISLLIPPVPKTATPEEKCRGAQLMGNLSELIMRQPPSPDVLHQAEAWASQALAVVKKARAESKAVIPGCEEVYAAALFNVATFREMSGDKVSARRFYKEGLDQARVLQMDDGIVEASKALVRIDSESEEASSSANSDVKN